MLETEQDAAELLAIMVGTCSATPVRTARYIHYSEMPRGTR